MHSAFMARQGSTASKPALNLRGDALAMQTATYNSSGVTYTAINQTQHDAARAAFNKLLAGNATVQTDLDALSMEAVPWVLTSGERVVLIREKTGTKSGKGAFAFRRKPSAVGRVLMVNHRTDDANTGLISADLFDRYSQFDAIGWNTISRTLADMTDLPIAPVTAFAQAVADTFVNGLFIEPHGFTNNTDDGGTARTTVAGQNARFIISAGVATAPAYITNLDAELIARGFTQVYSYSGEVTELGATLNEQGKAMRAIGRGRFCHIEMARIVRDSMVATQSVRTSLAEALLAI